MISGIPETENMIVNNSVSPSIKNWFQLKFQIDYMLYFGTKILLNSA